jgi:hypothetical protein
MFCKYNYVNLIFIGPCIVIYSYSTINKMHLLSQIIYSCKTLYMFRTVFPSINGSLKLRIQLLYTQSWALDYGRKDRPKHVEQCFSTAGPRPGTGPWHQLHRAAKGSPGICRFSFLSIFHEWIFYIGSFLRRIIFVNVSKSYNTIICYKISLVHWLITNLNVILYLSTCHTVYISVLILFMIHSFISIQPLGRF